MTEQPLLVFYDTTVLINFHRAGRLPQLGQLLSERMRWVGTVKRECQRKEQDLNLPGLISVSHEILGEPLFPDGDEHKNVRHLRQQMARPSDHPDEHLGEAETLTIISARGIRSLIATDDGDVPAFAHPIQCVTTWDLLRLTYRAKILSSAEVLTFWEGFVSNGNYPPKHVGTVEKLKEWLDE